MRPMLHHPRRFAQSGFTLVEIAIVLVIVGLLLGGVLKGQELIENARVKDAANIINGTAAAYNSYLDRYGRLPGDDNTVNPRGGIWPQVGNGNGNGSIDVNVQQTFTAVAEQATFWRHLRAAGFIKGEPTATGTNVLPRNSWGGLVGVTYLSSVQGRPANRLLVCMQNVPGKAAVALDRQLDDGVPNTGSLRATQGAAANPVGLAGAYNETQVFTICQEI